MPDEFGRLVHSVRWMHSACSALWAFSARSVLAAHCARSGRAARRASASLGASGASVRSSAAFAARTARLARPGARFATHWTPSAHRVRYAAHGRRGTSGAAPLPIRWLRLACADGAIARARQHALDGIGSVRLRLPVRVCFERAGVAQRAPGGASTLSCASKEARCSHRAMSRLCEGPSARILERNQRCAAEGSPGQQSHVSQARYRFGLPSRPTIG